MKLRLLGVALVAALPFSALPALASGLFPQLPASTSPGTAPANAIDQATSPGADITGQECIPADTGLTNGQNPATECISPSQLMNWATPHNIYSTIPIGSVAYGSLGTNTTPVAGTVYFMQLWIPTATTIGHIACMNGGTASTDKLLYSLYNSAGTLVANTSTSGTTATGTDSFQSLALTNPTATTYDAVAGKYWVGWQTNGTTTRFRTVAASTYIDAYTGSATGTFGTLPAITPTTSITADKGPICYVTS